MKIMVGKSQGMMLNAFRSKESVRFVLNCYGVKDGYIYSTDGRRCVRFKMSNPIEDGTYRAFTEKEYAYLFKEEELFPAAHNIMPDFSKLKVVCSVSPKKSDGISVANSMIDIYSKTGRAINLRYITDLDVAKYPINYTVYVKEDEIKDNGKPIYLIGDIEDKFFDKPEIIILPYRKD